MVNGRLRYAAGRKYVASRGRFALAPATSVRFDPGPQAAPADASNFMKIRDAFAANTRKIANPPFKPVC
jgi:hypothetical protein